MTKTPHFHESPRPGQRHAALHAALMAAVDLSRCEQALERILAGRAEIGAQCLGEGACFSAWKLAGTSGVVLKVAKSSWGDELRARQWLEACVRLSRAALRDDLPLVPGLLTLQSQTTGQLRVGLLMTEGFQGPASREMNEAHPSWTVLQDGLARSGLILEDHPQFLQTREGTVFVSDWSDLKLMR